MRVSTAQLRRSSVPSAATGMPAAFAVDSFFNSNFQCLITGKEEGGFADAGNGEATPHLKLLKLSMPLWT